MKVDKVSVCSNKIVNTNMQHNKRMKRKDGLPALCVYLSRLATSGTT